MATGGHWVDSHFGGSDWVDSHFGQDENDEIMEGGPALLIGAEDIELDCDNAMVGCGMPGDQPWKLVGVDLGFEGPVTKVRNWWAKRQAAKLAALTPKRRRPAPAVAKAQTLAARPADSGDATLDSDSAAASAGLGPMQDMDSEVEALNFAVQNDPYAIGQAL